MLARVLLALALAWAVAACSTRATDNAKTSRDEGRAGDAATTITAPLDGGAEDDGMRIGLGIGLGFGAAAPQFNEVSFASQAGSYTGVTITRSGADVYIEKDATTLEAKTGNTALWRNRQSGAGGGVFLGASYSNQITQPHDLSNAYWLKLNAPTIVGPGGSPGLGPDGATQMSSIEDTGATEQVAYKTGLTGTPPVYMSAWFKDSSPAPSGIMSVAYDATTFGATPFARTAGVLIGTGAAWRRKVTHSHGTGLGNVYVGPAGYAGGNAVDGSGLSAAFTKNAAATGKMLTGFLQVTSILADAPYAVPGSSTGNAVCSLDTPGWLVDSGDLDIEVEWEALQDAYDLQDTTVSPSAPDGHIWSGTSTDGEMSLRYVHGTTGNDQKFVLKVRGVDVLDTFSASGGTTRTPGWREGDVVRVRAWYRVSTGQCGIRIWVNNVTHPLGTITASTTGVALAEATVAHLGSLSGTSSFFPANYRFIRAYLATSPAPSPRPVVVQLGDSISGSYYRLTLTLAKVLTNAGTKEGYSTALTGDTIQGQQTAWTAIADKGAVAAVVIHAGVNNLSASETSTTVLSRLQTLIDTIKADKPTAKIVVCKILPCKGVFAGDATKYSHWQAVNTGIPSLTSVDAVVTGHMTPLNDGADNLLGLYANNGTDTVHPNEFGRQIIARYTRDALVSLGVLP